MVFHDNEITIWGQHQHPSLYHHGLDLRAVDLFTDQSTSMPYTAPLFRNILPQIMKSVRNPLNLDLPAVDFVDSDEQLNIIRHHYLSEFEKHQIQEVVKDYDKDATIYEVVDEKPHTYRGRSGVRQMCRDLNGKLQSIELQHVAINQNHAQVVWKGETRRSGCHGIIVGTDSFTFDKDNRITTQTIVALTEQSKK